VGLRTKPKSLDWAPMSIKITRIHYRGSKWVPLVWGFFFFPVAIVFFLFNAVMIEEEITPVELDQLIKS